MGLIGYQKVPLVVAGAGALEPPDPLAAAEVLGRATKVSVCVADAVPFVSYVPVTVVSPVAMSTFPRTRSNKASDAFGW